MVLQKLLFYFFRIICFSRFPKQEDFVPPPPMFETSLEKMERIAAGTRVRMKHFYTNKNDKKLWIVRTKEYIHLKNGKLSAVIINCTDFYPRKLEQVMKSLYRQNCELCVQYKGTQTPTIILNTVARSSSVVFITASDFLG